jgi:hypothetical protein
VIFDIDPDIRVAKTLTARVCSGPELFAGPLHPFMLLPAELMR